MLFENLPLSKAIAGSHSQIDQLDRAIYAVTENAHKRCEKMKQSLQSSHAFTCALETTSK